MLRTAALPFILRREHSVVSGLDVTATREHLHGLLHLDGQQLRIQWRTAREISHVGREIRTDRELAPLREVSIHLSEVAGVHIRRAWRRWWFGDVLVLTAADLRAFEALTDEDNVPGLVLEHPAELVLEVRRSDRMRVREFVSQLKLAISEHLLALYEDALQEEPILDEVRPSSEVPAKSREGDPIAPTSRQKA